jgi:gliding motility-associated-like protein
MLTIGSSVFQANLYAAPVTVTSCVGGVYRISVPADLGFPPGLATDNKGTWTAVPSDLTFSPPTVFQTIVSGFKPNTIYAVNWRSAKNGKDYLFYINVGNGTAQTGQIQVENPVGNWNSNDVVFCSGSTANYNYRISGVNLTSYEFWKTSSANVSTVWRSDLATSTATLNNGQYASQDVIWGVTTDVNGCKSLTPNQIRMSAMTSTQIRVVGGMSVCGSAVPPGLILEVQPYNTLGYTYQWLRNGLNIVGATGSTYTVTQFGVYSVRVSGCATTFTTNQINVEQVLLPDVTISGSYICREGFSSIITSSLSSPATVTYEWLYGGSPDPALGTNPFATATEAGMYQALIRSTSNTECYKPSNVLDIGMVNIDVAMSKWNNATPFCATDLAASRTPVIEFNITNGVAPYSVVLSNGSSNSNFSIASSGISQISLAPISSNTTYSVVSITDATGCTPALLPPSLTFTVERSPAVQTLSFTGGCLGSPLQVMLLNNEAGFSYTLRHTNAGVTTNIETIVPPAGGGFSFSTINAPLAGTYDVIASGVAKACPEVLMTGQVVVAATPLDQAFNPGPVCLGGALSFNSELGVRYYLIRDGIATGAYLDGTGALVSFGGLSAGTYTVRAVRGSCSRMLSGSLLVLSSPTVYTLSANKLSFCDNVIPTGVNLSLSGSQSGISYQLQVNTGAGYINYGAPVAGNNSPLNNQWTDLTEGNYRVVATTNVGGCSSVMSGFISVVRLPLPTATISNSMPNRRCAGTASSFFVNVTLTGAQPFNFDIVNNSGLPVIPVRNLYSNTYSIAVNPANSVNYQIVGLSDNYSCGTVNGIGVASFYVDPLPVITFSSAPNPISINASGVASTQVCLGSAVSLTANVTNTPGVKNYGWSDGLGNTATVSFTPNLTRTYSATVTNEYNCVASSPVEVVVNPLPVISFVFSDADARVCFDEAPVQLIPQGANTGGSFTSATPGAVAGNFFYPSVAGVGRHFVTYSFASPAGCVNTTTQFIDVNPLPVVQIRNLQAFYCADAGTVTINSTPESSDGHWSIVGLPMPGWFTDNNNGTASLNVGAALVSGGERSYQLVYTYIDPVTGCDAQAIRTTTLLNDVSNNVDFRTLPATMCQTQAAINLEAFFINTGLLINSGSFTGAGITNNQTAGVDNGTATFDPAVAGNGNHTITYTYRDPISGCIGSRSHTVQIGTVLNIPNLNAIYCKTDGLSTFYGTPNGGVLSVFKASDLSTALSTVFNSSPVNTLTFNPSVADADNYVFRYEFTDAGGCVNRIDRNVMVAAALDASFVLNSPFTQFCQSVNTVQLMPTQPGGVFTGPGVTLQNFSPQVAGPGTHTIRYTINTGTCSAFTERVVTVNALDPLWINNLADAYCDNETASFPIQPNIVPAPAATITFTTTTNATGKSPLYRLVAGVKTYFANYTGTDNIYFDPTNVGDGFYTVTLTYNNSANNGCITVYSKQVRVHPAVAVNFGGIADPLQYCQDQGNVTLLGSFESTGNYTGAGNFSGSGITETIANDGEALFNPVGLTPGTYPITYSLTLPVAQGGCNTSRTKNFIVLSSPAVYNVTPVGVAPNEQHYCEGGTGITIGVENSQATVTYQLIYNDNYATPAQTKAGSGVAISFDTPVTLEGVYKVRAVSADGCMVMMTGSVDVRKNKVAAAITSQDVSCRSGNDGQITVIASGGSAPYSYSINGTAGVASNVFTGLTAGNYIIQVTDVVGCTLAAPVTVTIDQPAAALSLSNLIITPSGCACTNNCDGSASFTISGGTPFPNTVFPEGYDIEWRDLTNAVVKTSSSVTGMAPGTYAVTVRDANACSQTINVTIGVLPVLGLTENLAAHVDVTCHGASTGMVTVNATGGSGAASYEFSKDGVSWFSNATDTYTFNALSAGTYTIRVRNAIYNRCEATVTTTITEPSVLNLTEIFASHVDIDCFGAATGQFEVLATGGSGVFEYSIDNGANWLATALFQNRTAGFYNVWVRDVASPACEYRNLIIRLTEPMPLNLILASQTNVSCNGRTDGSVTVLASGGTMPYQYSVDGINWQVSPMFSLGAGNHTISMMDSRSCLKTLTVTITQPAALSISEDFAVHQNVSCNGGNDGSFTILPSRAGTLEYSIDGGTTWTSQTTFSGLTAGGYQVSVRDLATNDVNNCEQIDVISISISEPTKLNISLVDSNNVTCYGGSDGDIEISATQGTPPYQYQWYRVTASGLLPVVAANGGNTAHATNLISGDYRVNVTDAELCELLSVPYSITQPAYLPNVQLNTITHVTVVGGSNGVIELQNITGGTAPYSIAWQGTDVNGIAVAGLINDNVRQENLVAGTYQATVTDGNGCVVVLNNLIVSQPGALAFVVTKADPQPCNGAVNGTINVSVSGGVMPYQSIVLSSVSTPSYPAMSTGSNFANFSGLGAGTYVATVIDDANNQLSTTIELFQADELMLDFAKTKDVACFGQSNGEVRIAVTGGTPNLNDPLNLLDDDYDVVITPLIGTSRNYQVVNGAALYVSDLPKGDYSLWVFDSRGCNRTGSFTIDEPLPVGITYSSKDVTCHALGEISATVTGRVGYAYQYDWYSVTSGVESPYRMNDASVITNVPAGQYRLRVTALTDVCNPSDVDVVINDFTPLSMTATPGDVTSCAGDATGTIRVEVVGGQAPYVLTYSGGVLIGNGPFDITGLTAGSYTLSLLDKNNCPFVLPNVLVNQPFAFDVTNVSTSIDCEVPNTGTLSFDVSGGVLAGGSSRYLVNLSGPVAVSEVRTSLGGALLSLSYANLSAGHYTLSVRDLNSTSVDGCLFEYEFDLNQININAVITDAQCIGVNVGAISLGITGGSGDYTYQWTFDGDPSFLETTRDISGLSYGTYRFTLTDNIRGCTLNRNYQVQNQKSLTIVGHVEPISCNGSSNGAIYIDDVTGAAGNVDYFWNGSPIAGIDRLTNLSGGAYQVRVVDAVGCSANRMFDVPTAVAISYDLSTALETCAARFVTLSNLQGGTGTLNDFTYSWSGPGMATTTAPNLLGMNVALPATPLLEGLTIGGLYTITVRDRNNCSVSQTIDVASPLTVDATLSHLNCSGDNNGTIVLHVVGGSGSYSYAWTTSLAGTSLVPADKDQTGLIAGDYEVVVTDLIENCSITRLFTLTQPSPIVITGDVASIICNGNNNGSIIPDVIGGTAPYQYNWSSVNGTGLIPGQKNQMNLSGGTYSLTVIDSRLCASTKAFTIAEPVALNFVPVVVNSDCFGSNSITVTNPTGGSGIYQFVCAGPGIASTTWNYDVSSAVNPAMVLTDLPGGDYTIVMTDVGIGVGQQCTYLQVVSITKPLKATYTAVGETCSGSANGRINIQVSDGQSPYQFLWSSSTGGNIINPANQDQNGLVGGDYQVTITDARLCVVTLDVTVPVLNEISVAAAVQNVRCFNGTTGAVDLTVTGGSGSYTYLWSGPGGFTSALQDISNVRSGGYSVVITDNVLAGCSVVRNFIIDQPALPLAVVDVTTKNIDCKGFASGEISVNVSGGTAPFNYVWIGPGALVNGVNNQTGLIAGTYQVKIIDANLCDVTSSDIILTEPAQSLALTVDEVLQVTVPGGNNGAIEVNVSGGTGNYNYTWEIGDGLIPETFTALAGATSAPRVENLIAGRYRVTVLDDNLCVITSSIIIVSEPGQPLSVQRISLNHVRPCNGNNNGSISVQITGGTPSMASGSATYHIECYNGGVLVDDADDVSLSLTGLSAGFYTFRAQDALGVWSPDLILEIREPAVLNITALQHQPVTCHSGSDGVVRVNVSGGTPESSGNYQITLIGSGVIDTRISNGVNVDFTGLPVGTYQVVVVDDADGDGLFSTVDPVGDDCRDITVVNVVQPEAIVTLSRVDGTAELCAGDLPQFQLVTADWPVSISPLRVALNDGTSVVVNTTPYLFTPVTAPSVGISNYTILGVIEDGTSCSKGVGTGTASVTVRPRPTAHLFGTPEICVGDNATLRVQLAGNGPWDVVVKNGGTVIPLTADADESLITFDVSPLVNTTYTLQSVSDKYCTGTVTGSANVTVNDLPSVILSGSATICEGNATNLTFDITGGSAPYAIVIKENGVERTVGPVTLLSHLWSVSPSITTTYELVSVVDSRGCRKNITGTAVVTVNKFPAAPQAIVGDNVVCQGATNIAYEVPAINDATEYEWILPAGFTLTSGMGSRSITVSVDNGAVSGTISVRGKNNCGYSGQYAYKLVNVSLLPVSVAGTITSHSGSTQFCQATKGLRFSVAAVANATQYVWHMPSGFNIVSGLNSNTIVVDLADDQASVSGDITVEARNNCGSFGLSAPLTVTINPLPSANAGNDDKVCGTSYVLKATNPGVGYSGNWELITGSADIVTQSANNSSVDNIAKGSHVFEWTVTNNTTTCKARDRVTITNNQLMVSAAASEYKVCGGAVTLLAATPPVGTSGLWTSSPLGAQFSSAVAGTTGVTNLAPGLNIMRWTVTKDGCDSYAEVNVINNEPSEAAVLGYTIPTQAEVAYTGVPIWVCGDAVTLRAKAINFGRGDGKWTVIKGAGVIASSTSLQTNINKLGIGENIFRWSVTLDGCVKSVDVIVRNNQLVVSAGKDQVTCLDQVTIVGTPAPSGSITGYWYVAKDNVSGVDLGRASFSNGSNFTTTVSNLAPDDNYLVWSLNQNGCISSDTVKITNNQPTKAIITGSNENICGYQFDLVANKAIEGNGYWSVLVGSGSFDDSFDETTTVRNIDKGLNTFRWNINKNGCSSYADIVVNNLKVNVFAGKDSAICRNQITLNSTPATVGVGEWSIFTGGATIFESNNPKSMATLSSGINQLIWSINNNGCLSSDTVSYANNTVVADAGGDQPDLLVISTSMNAVLKDKVNESGIWSVVSGRGEFVNPTSEDSRVNNIQAGENIYKWTVTRGGCVDDDLVVITNSGGIIANAGVPQTVCNGEAELHANDPETGVGYWSITPGTGNGSGVFVDYTSYKTRVTGLSPGRNMLRWTVAYPSGSTYSDVEITNNAVPEITAGSDLVTCNDTHTLEGTQVSSDFTIDWLVLSGGGGFSDRTIYNPIITGLAKGDNLLQMKVSKGICSRTSLVTITNDQPDLPRAGDDKTLCNDSVLLSPNTPLFGVGEWQTEGTTTAVFNGNWAKNLSSGPNTFAWVIRTANCELRDLVTITSNKPSLANAGQSVPVCVDSILLMANPPATGETGSWSTVVSGGTIANVNNPSTMVKGLSKGSNVFRWTIDNHGCKSTSDVAISYDFIEAIAGDPQSTCVDFAVLRANNPSPGIGSWGVLAGSSSVTIDDINLSNTTVRDLDQGLNTLIWTIRNGACVDTSHVIIRNNMPTTADAGRDFPTCDSDVSLSANIPQNGAGIGRWELLSGGGSFADVNNAKTRISGLSSGKNLLRWTIENNGCYSFDDVEVSYNMIFATVGPDQLNNCSSTAQLEANNPSPGVGTWSVIGGSSRASFADIHDPNSIVTNLGYGVNTLRWTIINAGCESPAAEVKVVNNSPSPSYAGNNDAICKDSTILDATVPYPGIGTWEVLTGGAVIDAADNAKTKVRSLSRGDNVFRWTVRNGTCFDSDEVLIVNNRPSDPYAGEDMEICILEQQLKANPPEYGQGVWTIPTGSATINDPSSSTTLATSIGYGRNVFRWTITRGQCSLFDEVVVVNNTASTALAGPDVQDCKNYAMMDANVPVHGVGNWSLVSGNGSFASVNDPKTQISGLNFGENVFLWTVTNGSCFSTDQVSIFNKVPDQANAGSDKTICDSYLTMYGNSASSGIGKWSVLSGAGDFVDAGAFNTVVNNVGFGENIFQWKITYGSCSTEDVVTVVNNRAYPNAGEDVIVYQPSHVLNAVNPGTKVTALWSIKAGNGVFGDNTFFNTQVTDLAEGVNTFSWTIDVNGCVVSDDVSITYKVVPDAGFISDVSAGCYPLTVQFTNYTVGGNSYFWDFGDGEVSVERNPVHTFESAGKFRVDLTVPGPDGKDGVYTSYIQVHDHPMVSFTVSPSLVYVPGDEIRAYNASTGGQTYLWQFGDGTSSTDQHPRYQYQNEGVFDVSLTVTNEFGCADSMVIEDAVTAILQGFIAFPNAFLPRPADSFLPNVGQSSGDAVFAPKYRDVDQYQLQIFDRWGQMIFESNDINIGWDGMYKGQLAPQDVYVFKSWGRFVSGREYQKTGNVLLVR